MDITLWKLYTIPRKQQEILAQIEPKEKLIELLKSNIEQAELEATQIMNQLFSTD